MVAPSAKSDEIQRVDGVPVAARARPERLRGRILRGTRTESLAVARDDTRGKHRLRP
jgi:hypothetical protein